MSETERVSERGESAVVERFGVRLYKEKFHFAAAHFLVFPEGDREELHGHNYAVRLELSGPVGAGEMVANFSRLKPLVQEACDALDHRMLIPAESPDLTIEEREGEVEMRLADGARFVFPRRDVVLLPTRSTTTERLSEWILARLAEGLAAQLPELEWSALRIEVEESGGQCGWHERRRDSSSGEEG